MRDFGTGGQQRDFERGCGVAMFAFNGGGMQSQNFHKQRVLTRRAQAPTTRVVNLPNFNDWHLVKVWVVGAGGRGGAGTGSGASNHWAGGGGGGSGGIEEGRYQADPLIHTNYTCNVGSSNGADSTCTFYDSALGANRTLTGFGGGQGGNSNAQFGGSGGGGAGGQTTSRGGDGGVGNGKGAGGGGIGGANAPDAIGGNQNGGSSSGADGNNASEPSLLAYYADQILEEKDLPIKMTGISACYRSEVGSYGKDAKGIYRIHEFMKVEQLIICKADITESEQWHEALRQVSEEILQDLQMPYRVLNIATGDMGAAKYKQYDIETWMPSRNGYGETHSDSNFTDWQARRLNIRYRDSEGKVKHAYTLNNTAIASPRILIPILENYQQADGSVVVPEALRPYVGKDVIKKG
jgi:hypothetical protein